MLNVMSRLFRKKYFLFLILVTVMFSVIGEAYHFFILSNMKTMTISLNYPGAEQGLNPDGSRFNISEMSNDEILNDAKSGLEIRDCSNDFLKSRLFITTKFSQKAMENVVSDIRNSMQGSYVPTTYYVYYSQKDKLARNETYEFLQALAESYEKYFVKKHAENNSILYYDSADYDFTDYDYSEIYTVLYDKADEMLRLIRAHRAENRSFRTEDNLNFDTVGDELANFRDVKLEKFNAYIVQNNISKNRPVYVNKLEYLINKSTVDYNKSIDASRITQNALNEYDPKIAAVAFVPSVDNTNSYYMSRTKTGIDDLSKDSYSEGMEAARTAKKIDAYQNRYLKLFYSPNTSVQTISYTDSYLNAILSDFEELSSKIEKLDTQYLKYKTENYFSYKIEERSKPVSVSMIIRFALCGFVFSVLIILYVEFLHRKVYRKTKSAKRAIAVMAKRK